MSERGQKIKQTQIERYGSEEAYRQEMKRRAAMRKVKVIPFGGRGYFGHLKDSGDTQEFKVLASKRVKKD
jgi:hypothetical protein